MSTDVTSPPPQVAPASDGVPGPRDSGTSGLPAATAPVIGTGPVPDFVPRLCTATTWLETGRHEHGAAPVPHVGH